MIIQCENCDSKYKVDLREIGDKGRFVRCSHCAHEWVLYKSEIEENNHQYDDSITNNTSVYRNSPHSSCDTNITTSEKSLSAAKLYISFLFIIISLIVNIFLGSIVIEDSSYYQYIQRLTGSDTAQNLKISDISIKMFPSKISNSQEIALNFVIHNDGDNNERASNLRITAFDKDRKRIAELVSPSSYIINARETRSIYSLIKDVPLETRYISIEFSNHLDMILRPSTSLITGKIL